MLVFRTLMRRAAAAIVVIAAYAALAAEAQAIVNGRDATPTPLERATVSIGDPVGCTGTLVAPDLVLTAGHCVTRPEAGSFAPFRPSAITPDWQRPDRFYPLGRKLVVRVGTVVGSSDRTTASEYALPGLADMLLLRLDEAVTASAATTIPILSQLPRDVSDPAAWVAAQTFDIAGFGDDDDDDGRVIASTHLNVGRSRGGRFPCAGYDAHKLCVSSADGSAVRQGDSGGPLYWTDRFRTRWVVGVLQRVGGVYTPTFFRGGASNEPERHALSNLGGWLEQLVSGRRGGTAFLRTTEPGIEHVGARFAANPSGLLTRVRRIDTGEYVADFEGLRERPCLFVERRCIGGEPRAELVTALDAGSAYCKLGPGADPAHVPVRCYGVGGAPVDARFSLLTQPSGSGVVIRVPAVTVPETHLATDHGDVRVTRASTGVYRVDLIDYDGPAWRNVIVSAQGADAIRCHPDSWGRGTALVRCFTPRGVPAGSGFTLAATSGRDTSYATSMSPSAPLHSPPSGSAQTAGSSTRPSIRRSGIGRYRIEFAGLPASPGGNVQVSAVGSTRNHCSVQGWAPTTVEIACFNPDGALADTRFVVRSVDPLDTGRRVRVTLNRLWSILSDDRCPRDGWRGTLELSDGATGTRNFAAEGSEVTLPTIEALSRPGARTVIVSLSLRDDDSPSCGGADDRVDLATASGVESARFRVDLQAGTVEVLDGAPRVLGGLGTWWTNGEDGVERARAELSVTVTP